MRIAKWISFSWMIMKWSLMWNAASSEVPETRQHFFLFFPDFYFYPWLVRPAALPANAGEVWRKRTFLAECAIVCQYFFVKIFLYPRITPREFSQRMSAFWTKDYPPSRQAAARHAQIRPLQKDSYRRQRRKQRLKFVSLETFSLPSFPSVNSYRDLEGCL